MTPNRAIRAVGFILFWPTLAVVEAVGWYIDRRNEHLHALNFDNGYPEEA